MEISKEIQIERSMMLARKIAEKGEEIYARKFKAEYEKKYFGKFLTIDPESEKAYLGNSDYESIKDAITDAPETIFYTLRIGFKAAHKIRRNASFLESYAVHASAIPSSPTVMFS